MIKQGKKQEAERAIENLKNNIDLVPLKYQQYMNMQATSLHRSLIESDEHGG
jgi:hypothetical protein